MPNLCRGSQHTMGGKAIPLVKFVPVPDRIRGSDILRRQNIWKLLLVSHDDNILGTGERQHTGRQIHLRGLVHYEIVIDKLG